MTADTPIDYGAILAAEDEAILAREQAVARERADWSRDARSYVERLKRHELPLPEFAARIGEDQPTAAATAEPVKPAYDGVTRTFTVGKPRVGAQRGAVLMCIARATLEGNEITSREVSEETGQEYKRVVNAVWLDVDRGILAYPDDFHPKAGFPKPVKMTELGFDILRKAGLLEPASKE